MNDLYPLKFKPIFKERIWGGEKIKTKLGLDFSPLERCGEAWVLSGVPGSQTEVSNGFLKGNELNELVEIYMDDLVGESVFEKHNEEFPILIKFLDSREYLSIQVHPDDALARKRKLKGGKTEAWYVVDAEPGSELISGFNREMDRDLYLNYFEKKRLKEILNFEKVNKGDLFFMPAGRIHALGSGLLIAEIQQTSDTTYRIYDWDRVDDQGKSRDLHTDLALDAIDFSPIASAKTRYTKQLNASVPLIDSPFFSTNLIEFTEKVKKDLSWIDSFVIYLCTEGKVKSKQGEHEELIKAGEALLVPACIDEIELTPYGNCTLLEVLIS